MQLSAHTRSKGFALLITVTLLAFLVLLLVSLASLTRVETQVASNNQQLSQARQNALMALNIAIGQLQKYVGPDQRTTARSDMDATLASTSTKSGRWLGAYGNGAVADYGQTPDTVSANIVTAATSSAVGSQAKLLNWLVSGNETAAFDPVPGGANVGTKGDISTPPAAPALNPTDAVTNLTVTTTALDKTIKIKGTREARLLVGANTVGSSVEDYVVAPLQDINASLSWLGGTKKIGRYAWWVGDEGAKARICPPIPLPSTATEKANAFVSSQRAAIELIDAKNPSASTTDPSIPAQNTTLLNNMLDRNNSLSLYNPSNPDLLKLLTPSQLPITATTAVDANTLKTAVQYRYHDITNFSVSVLSDTYGGGLKKDLSAILRKGLIGTVTPVASRLGSGLDTDDTDFIYPPQTNITGTGSNTTDFPYNELGLPTWGQLRSFATTTVSTSGLAPTPATMATSPVAPNQFPAPTSPGIAPVVTYIAAGFQYIAPSGDAVINNPIQLVMLPIVVLWNPYTSPINAAKYEVGISKVYYGKIQLQGMDADKDAAGTPWSEKNIMAGYVDLTAPAGGGSFFRFIIDNSAGLQPGQSLVFTLTNPKDNYSAGTNILTNSYQPSNYVILNNTSKIGVLGTGSNTPIKAGGVYRVAVNSSPTAATVSNPYPSDPRNIGTSSSPVWIPATMWSAGNEGNHWGGQVGAHQAYLAPVLGANHPTVDLPFKGGVSQQMYQVISTGGAYAQTPPYGNGNPNSGLAITSSPDLGVVQQKGALASQVTKPPFRLVMRTIFSGTDTSGARNRWAFGNSRAMIGGSTGRPNALTWPPNLNTTADGLEASSGTSLEDGSGQRAVLYEFRPDTMPLLSIGQLQHANLGWLAGGYLIGNSNGFGGCVDTDAGGRVTAVVATRLSSKIVNGSGQSSWSVAGMSPTSSISWSYDHSWLLNRALWDRYFISTIPHQGTGTISDTESTTIPTVLPNPNIIQYNSPSSANLRDAKLAAANLVLRGGFNVNSTSEQAWRAILGGSNQLKYDPVTGNTTTGWPKIIYSRFSKPMTNSTSDAWNGYKQLNEQQISALAKNIVSEIRNRGPFISLADFINRRLYRQNTFPLDVTSNGSDTFDPRLKGTIQNAIDKIPTTGNVINAGGVAPFDNSKRVLGGFQYINDPGHPTGYPDNPFLSSSTNPANPPLPYATSAAGAPQFLTQADVLTAIGNQLTARSDTFVIRTYGEVLDPVNSTVSVPVVLGQAWCEAVVQRLPDYVEPKTAVSGNSPEDTSPSLTSTNQAFGRKFKIITFRWLSPQDI